MGLVQLDIVRGRNLAARDITGKSDPYCVINVHPAGRRGVADSPHGSSARSAANRSRTELHPSTSSSAFSSALTTSSPSNASKRSGSFRLPQPDPIGSPRALRRSRGKGSENASQSGGHNQFQYTTQIQKQTVNPEWHETCTFYLGETKQAVVEVTIEAFDAEIAGESDFLGSLTLHLIPMSHAEMWYPLTVVRASAVWGSGSFTVQEADRSLFLSERGELGEIYLRWSYFSSVFSGNFIRWVDGFDGINQMERTEVRKQTYPEKIAAAARVIAPHMESFDNVRAYWDPLARGILMNPTMMDIILKGTGCIADTKPPTVASPVTSPQLNNNASKTPVASGRTQDHPSSGGGTSFNASMNGMSHAVSKIPCPHPEFTTAVQRFADRARMNPGSGPWATLTAVRSPEHQPHCDFLVKILPWINMHLNDMVSIVTWQNHGGALRLCRILGCWCVWNIITAFIFAFSFTFTLGVMGLGTLYVWRVSKGSKGSTCEMSNGQYSFSS